ncbi:hypothetical protein SARC_10427 [Sphaeroforma arctica JP610]|uniref:Uncharacterized protein n=1 Tax=Sphaeroforma arctica JP610 TaxID=667725 RepID=A0A0L0FM59_9EUKA|nr:hypothetical protein SARC_10427 [Sphaeroforma arctica JP610]KNC77103.1 hypothetical protein SARC_10427 [Sphaeroforma arctica JP610]|eukprot:XP_014151005.1 hypothetical protein SARC_10427 [Sphaeroforma arctica JP610]
MTSARYSGDRTPYKLRDHDAVPIATWINRIRDFIATKPFRMLGKATGNERSPQLSKLLSFLDNSIVLQVERFFKRDTTPEDFLMIIMREFGPMRNIFLEKGEESQAMQIA